MVTEIYVDCKDALESGHTSIGIYTINPDEQTPGPFKVIINPGFCTLHHHFFQFQDIHDNIIISSNLMNQPFLQE